MPGDSYQDRTEKPTAKRRQDARKKGQVAQSREIPSVAILMTSLVVFLFAGSGMFGKLSGFMGGIFRNLDNLRLNDVATTSVFVNEVFATIFQLLIPFLLAVLVAGVLANVAQFGFLLSSKAMTPKFSKINPINGIKKVFSLKSLVELAKSIFKILFIGGIAYLLVKQDLQTIPSLMHWSVLDIFRFTGNTAFKICFYVCLALIVLAAIDFAYQRWEHEKSLKMTKQEVKDEHKQTEGDPKIKARIRRVQMEMAQRRMMEAVPEADVVITNPTHLAVALKFDAAEMSAPQVIAKGADHVAQRIKAVADTHQVPIIENKPLAQTLYKTVEIGDVIPAELYKAVAEILAYVYRLKGLAADR
jgi:flagellar biosynthetic protein FlhB